MQNSKGKEAKQNSKANPFDMVRCPECGKTWPDLAALGVGAVRSLNLALIATCPNCGHVWGVNHLWRLRKIITELPTE